MRILILEPHGSGHHATYLRWIVEGVRARGWSCVVGTTTATLDHPLLKSLSWGRSDGIALQLLEPRADWAGPVGKKLQQARREWGYLKTFRQAALQMQPRAKLDAVVLPYVDYCFHALALSNSAFGGLPWCGISMRLSLPAKPASQPWKWRLTGRLLRQPSLRALFSINPSVQDAPASWFAGSSEKLRYLPDPAEQRTSRDRATARARLGIEADSLAVLVFGTIDERKGLEILIDSLVNAPHLARFVVIVAGRQSPSIRERMRSGASAQLRGKKRLIELDRFLSDDEQAMVFAASDVVWAVYVDHQYTSGVLVLAGQAALPVISSDVGEMAWMVHRYGTGLLVRGFERSEVASALASLQDEGVRAAYGERAKTAFALHTPGTFVAAVLDSVA